MKSVIEDFYLMKNCALICLWKDYAQKQLLIYAPFERWRNHQAGQQTAPLSVEGYFSFRGRGLKNLERFYFTGFWEAANREACREWMRKTGLSRLQGAREVMEALMKDEAALLPIVMALVASIVKDRRKDLQRFETTSSWNALQGIPKDRP